jgi:hypothetical protein
VSGDVTRDFTATGGVADMDDILEVELLDKLGEVVGVGIHVVAGPGLARTAMAAAVMGDAAIAA